MKLLNKLLIYLKDMFSFIDHEFTVQTLKFLLIIAIFMIIILLYIKYYTDMYCNIPEII